MPSTRLFYACISFLVISAAVQAAGPVKRIQYDPGFYAPSEKVITPHIPWAKPYAQGEVKILIICPRHAMREVVELSQRLSVKYTAVFTEGRSKLGESGTGPDASWKAIVGNAEEEITEDLRSKLKDNYHVIVIGHLDWEILPIDVRYEILKAVKAGTGLLLVDVRKPDQYLSKLLKRKGDDPAEFLASGFPFKALPAYEKATDAKSFLAHGIISSRLGQGRVLTLRGSHPRHFLCPGKANPDEPQIDYDYYLALAIRGILWVARKEPPIIVSPDVPLSAKFDRKELAEKGFEFTLKNQGDVQRVDLLCVVRSREGRPVWNDQSRQVTIEPGEKRIKFIPPLLPAGPYFADLFVSNEGKAITWGSCLFEITSPYFIKEIQLAKDAVSQSEPLSGKVMLGKCAAGQHLILTQIDNWLRVVTEHRIGLKDGLTEVPFEIKPVAPPTTIIQNLHAMLIAGDDTLDAKKVEFSITDLFDSHDDFQFVMWASVGDNSFIDRHVWRICREYGCDTFYTHYPLMSALRENLRYIPYITRFVDNKTDWCKPQNKRMKGDLVRDPCLTNPEYRESTRKDLLAKSEKCRKYSVHDVSLGDECLFVAGAWDLCFSPTCVKDFQEYVKKVYGDIARLNTEYGTSYKDWSEVKPITLEEARKTNNPAQWVDHRLHMEKVWASFHGYARQCIREIIPQAKVGHEGSNTQITSFQAGDFWQLMRNMDFNCIYLRPWTIHQLRDFGDPGIMSSFWYGGYEPHRNAPMQRFCPWFALFNGMNSQWEWFNYGGAGAVVAYDFTPYPFFEAAIEEIREIKSGVGKLLINAKRQHDGVALLFSPSSVHANTYAPVLEHTRYENVFGSYLEVTKHIGINVRMLAYEELAKGKLNSGEFNVLILPLCQALSGQEVAEIKKFIKNGGAVIADLKPGTCDEHGKPHQTNPLEEVFGVKISSTGEKKRVGEIALAPEKAASIPTLAKWRLSNVAVDEMITVTTGEALARMENVPVIIGNKYGRGQGIYLNFTFAPYMELVQKRDRTPKDYEAGTAYRELMRALLSVAGVEPQVLTEPEMAWADIARFAAGPAQYVGILQELPEDPMKYTRKEVPEPGGRLYTLLFPQRTHLYDVRKNEYLGKTDRVLTTITPARAKLFAMMPYKIEGLRLTGDTEVKRGGQIKCKIELQVPGADVLATHVVRLNVYNPDGKLVSFYSQNVLVQKGETEAVIHLALNDQTGRWQLKAREIVSGKEATLHVNVFREN